MAKSETIKINELVQDDHNFNRGTERGKELIKKSFVELGAGRSILIDKDNRIIAGNKSQIGAIDAGIEKVRIIETDGTELIAVKRTDISLDSKKGRELALADNATTESNLQWDEEELEKVSAEFGILPEDWDVKAVLDLPDDLDMSEDETKKKSFQVILNFKTQQEINRFLDTYKAEITNDFDVMITVHGGDV